MQPIPNLVDDSSNKKTVLSYSFKNQESNIIAKEMTHLIDESLELHFKVFKNDLSELKKCLAKLKKDFKNDQLDSKLNYRDKYGNTPLHLAVMLGNLDATKLLIESGSRVKIRNEQFWTPLHEAISLRNRELIRCLYKKYIDEAKNEFDNSVPRIKMSLKEMLDFYVEIKWDFESWIPFVSRFLPSDVCKLYKKGSKIRIETTLEDIARAAQKNSENSSNNSSNSNSEKFSPLNWRRGDLTFLIDIQQDKNKSSVVFLDNNKKTYLRIDPRQSEDIELEADCLEKELDFLLSTEIVNVKLDTTHAEFAVTEVGWFNKKPKAENLNGYFSNFYDVKNLYVVSKVRLEHLSEEDLKKKAIEQKKFLEYFGGKTEQTNYIELSQDESENQSGENNTDDSHPKLMTWEDYMNHSAEKFPVFGRRIKLKQNRKEFKAQLAMSEEFPLNITELNNLLEALAPLGKFRRLKDFVDLKLPPGFPVKIEIPIIATISAKVCFQNFKRDLDFDESLFQIPHGYEEIKLE
ncbi:unnamed protein product [Brachionus calyciflorus]|uniref:Ankyrin repeat domain-containing protein n=1 Tax=Brachionus calyciflorus TaxID=104777 RepID=A0A814NM42_9BILA|nr:unnamed protein product [Brachionus calyciflorus]